MTWRASVLTLFPEMFPGPLGYSLAGKALENQIWSLETIQIRDFCHESAPPLSTTRPFGGGAGMVLRPDVIDAALQGPPSTLPAYPVSDTTRLGSSRRRMRPGLAGEDGVILLCGRYRWHRSARDRRAQHGGGQRRRLCIVGW